MKKKMKNKIKEFLELASATGGSEYGGIDYLLACSNYNYVFSDKFSKAIEEELEYQFKRLKIDAKLVKTKEHTRTIKQKVYESITVVWNDDINEDLNENQEIIPWE